MAGKSIIYRWFRHEHLQRSRMFPGFPMVFPRFPIFSSIFVGFWQPLGALKFHPYHRLVRRHTTWNFATWCEFQWPVPVTMCPTYAKWSSMLSHDTPNDTFWKTIEKAMEMVLHYIIDYNWLVLWGSFGMRSGAHSPVKHGQRLEVPELAMEIYSWEYHRTQWGFFPASQLWSSEIYTGCWFGTFFIFPSVYWE